MDKYYFTYHAAAQCFLLCALTVRPSRYRWTFFLPTAGLNLYCYFLTPRPTNDDFTNMGMRGSVITYIAIASDYILLTDVQRKLFLIGQREPISNAGFGARLKWALQLFTSPRGVGWTHEPTSSLPHHPKLTRVQFLVSGLGWLVVLLLLNDLFSILIRANPFLARDAIPLVEQPLLWRFLGASLIAAVSALSVIIPHVLCSMFAVGTGLSDPDMWPHIMGRWSDAYTIRRFWGRTWHQILRRIFSSHGKFVAHRVLNLSPGGNLSSYTQLYIAFLISGFIHTPSNASGAGAMRFFLSQALAITFEDLVIASAKRAGLKQSNKFLRRLGYIWVYCWFVYSLPSWMDFEISSGAYQQGGMNSKFSLILGLYRGKWYAER